MKVVRRSPIRCESTGSRATRASASGCPGKKDRSLRGGFRWERDLERDLAVLRADEVNVLVSLLEPHELELLQVFDYAGACRRAGIELVSFPIVDQHVPTEEGMRSLVGELVDRGRRGQTIVIHCRGGLGRTGTVAGCLLVEQGCTADEAFAVLRAVRSPECPERDVQRTFVREYARTAGRSDLPTLDRRARIEGGLVGALVGDALGVPYEFTPASAIPPREQLELTPPAGFDRAHREVPPGTWSDDGAQALCLLESLLEKGTLDVDDLGRRFVDWLRDGHLAVDARVFDVGVQTSIALRNLQAGVSADGAGPAEERSNGNGSLMRVLPLALWHHGSDEDLVRDAHRQSRVTHGHIRSQVCCALYCLWARYTLAGAGRAAWGLAVRSVRAVYRADPAAAHELEAHVQPDRAPGGKGSGYVLDALHSARAACEAGGYEDVVRAAIAMGDDTDTTACIAGGIAGLREGIDAIPVRWRSGLRGRVLLDPLLARLLDRGC